MKLFEGFLDKAGDTPVNEVSGKTLKEIKRQSQTK
jgi:hypothetical protein